ncbi:hypothetical protein [Sphingomonas sp. PAMC 26621]|uniref:hypothetical protein n=1 Tax=Sphingomonas sp. PAMC 26621 TaxID=1112213 RepID=UPI000289CA5A|nr:hypothetical protein [Sphingomonas sp. PAMC 26621]
MRVRFRSVRQHPSQVLLPLWIVLVVAFFTWQAGTYRGLIALLAEWQFNEFGVYHPLLTFLLFVLILAPLPFLFTRRHRKSPAASSAAVPASDVLPVRSDLSRAIGEATRFLNVLLVAAVGCLAAALLACGMILMLPTAAGPIQRISASATLPETPSQGLTELRGAILYTRTSAFDEDLWLTRRNIRFAPMVDAGADPSAVRYFIELSPTDGSQRAETISARQGILVKDALPGELFRLYRYAGFRVTPTHYVLFRSAATMRWPYWVWASEFAVGAFLIALGALVQWFRRRRLIARDGRPVAEADA